MDPNNTVANFDKEFTIFDQPPNFNEDGVDPDGHDDGSGDEDPRREDDSMEDVATTHDVATTPPGTKTNSNNTSYEEDEDESAIKDGSDSETEDVGGIEYRPSYKNANKLSFAKVCEMLEFLDKYQTEKNSVKRKLSKEGKLKIILPPQLLKKLEPGSPFPLFRLLMSDRDTSRKFNTREASIATAYSDALGLLKTPKADALKNFTNVQKVSKAFREAPPAGDFAVVVEYVIREYEDYPPSKATIGDINKSLDNLVAELSNSKKTFKGKSGRSESSQWQFSQHTQSQRRATQAKVKKRKTAAQVRKEFFDRLINIYKLSPTEHKWLVRMMLPDSLKLGLGFEAILKWWNKHAENLWKSHNSLMAVCDNLSNPGYIKQLEERIKQNEEESRKTRFNRLFNFDTNLDAVRIGSSLSAMKSERTSFEECMYHMAKGGSEVLKKLPKDDPVKHSLALKFPAFVSEIKLDGERMVVHVHRGKVTMHTRQGRWYSPLYSPIVGPALRRATSTEYDIDIILDGEILAWDNNAGQTVEFGNNRTVAILRQNWLRYHGQIEDMDRRLHEGEKDAYVMEFDEIKHWKFDNQKNIDPDSMEGGDQCWIKFVAFDVLFVGGPDAKKAIADALSLGSPSHQTTSVADMDGFERKRILYHILKEEKNHVEIVETCVIRPSGECSKGEDYFSSSDPVMECGLPAYRLDSAKWTLNEDHPSLKEYDNTRRKGRSDIEISRRRTLFVNNFYHSIVHEKKLEGLVFKDLAAPYILRRKTGLWRKVKPDYHKSSSVASDIDVVIIGASYGVGMKRGGQVASFLCACYDSKNDGKFMPFVRLNAKSVNERTLEEIMDCTGFVKGVDGDLGMWFMEEEHGKTLPDFISKRTLQFGKETNDGWKFDRVKNYPDLFIRPSDSVVLTVNAAEIVSSDEYSAGVTLRFPRIDRPRLGADAKPPEEVETEAQLFEKLQEYKSKMREFAKVDIAFEIASPSKTPKRANNGEEASQVCQFLTKEQYEQQQKQKKKKDKKSGLVRHVRQVPKESNALLGIRFHVLEGSYVFDPEGLDAEQAKGEGWLEEAEMIFCASDVETFIIKHGGEVLRSAGLDVYLVGASPDMKTTTVMRGMDGLRKAKESKNEKKRKKGEDVEEITTPAGVLKWTYVLSLVKRWQNEVKRRLQEAEGYSSDEDEPGDYEMNDESVLTTLPHMMKPRFFDLLAQSEAYGEDPLQSIWSYGPLDTTTMKQALSVVQQAHQPKKARTESSNFTPWQKLALEQIPPEKRWIMSSEQQKLWPYGEHSSDLDNFGPAFGEKRPVLVYPDCPSMDSAGEDTDDTGRREEAQTEGLASALPLLRSMGSCVTFHLTENVTHVLCDLAGTIAAVPWHPGEALDVFTDTEHGAILQEQLEDSVGHPVLLITQAWVNSLFEI